MYEDVDGLCSLTAVMQYTANGMKGGAVPVALHTHYDEKNTLRSLIAQGGGTQTRNGLLHHIPKEQTTPEAPKRAGQRGRSIKCMYTKAGHRQKGHAPSTTTADWRARASLANPRPKRSRLPSRPTTDRTGLGRHSTLSSSTS